MGLTTFSRLGCVVLLLTYGVSGPGRLCADEANVAASDLKEETFGSAADQGRLVWALLEAIEQHHIAPPPRQALIRVITRTFFRVPKDAPDDVLYRELLESLDAEFLKCQSADEMAKFVERTECLQLDFGRVIADLKSGFGEILGEFHLIRSKDHDVEEQFRGNRYVGLGVGLRMNPSGSPSFARIVPGSAADRGGLVANTYIHEIDGRSTENLSQEKILDLLRGPAGSDVTLKVSTDQSKEQRDVTLTRGVVRFESLKNRNHQSLNRDSLRIDQQEPIGWIHVETINGSTLHELRVAEQRAKEDGIQVLVLDFRGNETPGDLHQALLVADSLLDGGAICERIEGSAEPKIEYADRECLFREVRLVVLIDLTTGPFHSVIAAALRDSGRAKLVGRSAEFKGFISSTVRLSGVPYSLTMNTIRLNRLSDNYQWPLIPDYSIAQNDGVAANQPPIPQGFRMGNRMILDSDLNTRPSDVGKMTSSIEAKRSADSAKSDQDPQRRSNASEVVAQDTPKIPQVPKSQQNDQLPVRRTSLKRQLPIEDLAILVAMEIQRGLPPRSVQPVAHAQDEQSKESIK